MSLPGGLTEDDYVILKFFADRELVANPKTVAANTDIEPQRVKHRLRFLLEEGLVKRPSDLHNDINPRGLYEATKLGAAYGRGDKTIDELRELMSDSAE